MKHPGRELRLGKLLSFAQMQGKVAGKLVGLKTTLCKCPVLPDPLKGWENHNFLKLFIVVSLVISLDTLIESSLQCSYRNVCTSQKNTQQYSFKVFLGLYLVDRNSF